MHLKKTMLLHFTICEYGYLFQMQLNGCQKVYKYTKVLHKLAFYFQHQLLIQLSFLTLAAGWQ